ncbi:hypothetical protein NQZ68_034849 [Dissostichus eleginoides]|nr:hypothetical protein NQZ68_034849 [Dissostichus eleginoides]
MSNILTGGRILVHSRARDTCLELSGHNQEVNCLDAKGGLIVSGSRDRTARMWTLTSSHPRDTFPMSDRVWSVAISPTLRLLLCAALNAAMRLTAQPCPLRVRSVTG